MKRVRAEILSTRKMGAYHSLTLVAPEIAERAHPGQFLTMQMPEDREYLLRSHFFIHQASRRGGWAGTLEFVLDPVGPGSEWLANAKAHEFLDVIGPLGKGFAYPKHLTNCLLIAEGHGAASLYFLAQELVARHKRVDMVVGGDSLERVFKPIEGKRLSQTIEIVTRMAVSGAAVRCSTPVRHGGACASEVLYAAAPRRRWSGSRRSVENGRSRRRWRSRSGWDVGGLCFTCVVPVARKDGSGYEHLRSCVDGPVFNPARVLWDRWLSDAPTMLPTPPEGLPVVRSWPG